MEIGRPSPPPLLRNEQYTCDLSKQAGSELCTQVLLSITDMRMENARWCPSTGEVLYPLTGNAGRTT